MHLKKLKIAGFKSFVDPIVVPFSSQLTGVVGPNGCGKSNIIDAVRWVMGESHAKNLRGESMVDVIFNGSVNRKPIGLASVELIFDNSGTRLFGEYASYQEISLKRVLTRDGDSTYYLNGSRCRRRDVTDIFAGTGVGPRSYSIISQGIVSRFIEAPPEEMRTYVEEAAGVSLYKERRRETIQRIRDTRENLARVADIREELQQQVVRLEQQSREAKRFKHLKQQERLFKSQCLTVKWQIATQEMNQTLTEYSRVSGVYDEQQRTIAMKEIELQEQQLTLDAGQGALHVMQAELSQIGTDLIRLDELLQQKSREKQRIAAEKQQLDEEIIQITESMQQQTDELVVVRQRLDSNRGQVDALRIQLTELQAAYQNVQQREHAWRTAWNEIQASINQLTQDRELARIRHTHIQQQIQQIQIQIDKNQQERLTIQVQPVNTKLEQLQQQRIVLRQEMDEHELQRASMRQTELNLRQEQAVLNDQLKQTEAMHRAEKTEYVALLAVQRASFGKDNSGHSSVKEWEGNARLAEILNVDESWITACEMVLAEQLNAIVLKEMNDFWPKLSTLKGQGLNFIHANGVKPEHAPLRTRLIDKFNDSHSLNLSALQYVYTVDSLEEAIACLPTLQTMESVITADGYWLGPGWVKIACAKEPDTLSTLSRQRLIDALQQRVEDLEKALHALQTKLDALNINLEERIQQDKLFEQSILSKVDALRSNESAIKETEQSLRYMNNRHQALDSDLNGLQENLSRFMQEDLETQHTLNETIERLEQLRAQSEELTYSRSEWEQALLVSQSERESVTQCLQQQELQTHRDELNHQQLLQTIAQHEQRLEFVQQRLNALVLNVQSLDAYQVEHAEHYQQKKDQLQALEQDLLVKKQDIALLRQQKQDLEQSTQKVRQERDKMQRTMQQLQLNEQTLRVRSDGLLESLRELADDETNLFPNLPEEANLTQLESDLHQLTQELKQLGAVNLVAIDEYERELLRKQNLDTQYDDLNQALNILEEAIAKIDAETKLRFKETFDEINVLFQTLFPRLFGGGRGRLELTCDNVLEAGVQVMAQPPGKCNTTIQLLSGGEKAMTAVALVFAIFQLNPSPFCMLDEVDAPLDDANVFRFCELVKEMSKSVQFIFITHNKKTMELAEQLIGVTMSEPGVSRIVGVDVDAALFQNV